MFTDLKNQPENNTDITPTVIIPNLADTWGDITSGIKSAFSTTSDKLDKTSDTVTKATATANKALDMVQGMMSIMKPVAIAAGVALGALVLSQTYLNIREIIKGGK